MGGLSDQVGKSYVPSVSLLRQQILIYPESAISLLSM